MKNQPNYFGLKTTIWLEKKITRRFPPGVRKAKGVGRVKKYSLFVGHVIGPDVLVFRAKKPK